MVPMSTYSGRFAVFREVKKGFFKEATIKMMIPEEL